MFSLYGNTTYITYCLLYKKSMFKGKFIVRFLVPRSQCLQRAKASYGSYRNDYDNLNSWLSRVPNYEPYESDTIQQVDGKLKNQRVSPL